MCKGFATELTEDVTRYALYNSSQSIEKHDPEDLPEINIVSGSNRRKYRNGKLHNLKRCVQFVMVQWSLQYVQWFHYMMDGVIFVFLILKF